MYLSLNWLKDFVNIPRSMTPEELGLRLTTHTVEIDSVARQAEKFAGIVVGKILEIKKHPNADKLLLVRVDVKREELDIVCGASNIEAGQMVPVAKVGAVLPNGMEIKEAEIRGVKSSGMLCAEDELGLGDDHSGILILDGKAKPGQKLADYFKLSDIIFEVDNKSITHRPDLWSHYGMAREVSAFLGVRMKEYNANPRIYANIANTNNANVNLDVKVEDFELCPRYMAVVMDGITVESSPKWIQERLIAVGVRPINNIVDTTNYVMLELGQPLHAFDMKQIATNIKTNSRKCNIVVRRAKKGEVIKTLDEQKRELDDSMLVITNGKEPVAVAGVMGGINSEIENKTGTIVLESANFDFISIRKTAQKLGLRTEASMRFEKSLDPNLCESALTRAVELIKEVCPQAKIVSEAVDEKKFKLDQEPIELDLDWLSRFIGVAIKDRKVTGILESLGFGVKTLPNPPLRRGREELRILSVAIPTWRATRDVSIKEDLAEEIARVYGYDNIAPAMPRVEMKTPTVNKERLLERRIKNILTGAPTLTEAYNYSFVGEEQLKKFGFDYSEYIRLSDPISANFTMLRQNLAPNLILNIKTNQARFEEIKLFEIGSVYLSNMSGEEDRGGNSKDKLPYQEKRLGIVIAGDNAPYVFSAVKGAVDHLISKLGLAVIFSPTEISPSWANPAMSAEIMANQTMLGSVCGLDNKTRQTLGIKKQAALAEISLKELFNLIKAGRDKKYLAYGKYPPVVRDLAFVVDEEVLYNDIREEIFDWHEYIKQVDLFDVYQGDKIGREKKSLAFHIIYQTDRTMTASEVDKLQAELIKKLEERFEAKIRDF